MSVRSDVIVSRLGARLGCVALRAAKFSLDCACRCPFNQSWRLRSARVRVYFNLYTVYVSTCVKNRISRVSRSRTLHKVYLQYLHSSNLTFARRCTNAKQTLNTTDTVVRYYNFSHVIPNRYSSPFCQRSCVRVLQGPQQCQERCFGCVQRWCFTRCLQ